MTWLRPRKPSASMIVALIALFVALGGSSYAAVTLAKNSVGTKQLKKNAVTTPKIKNGAVTASKINPAGMPFESSSDVMRAVVTNSGTPTVTSGTAGVSASEIALGYVAVHFPRSVAGCVAAATQGNSTSTYVPPYFATVRNDGKSNDVGVVTYDTSGNQVDTNFQLIVVC